MTIMCPTLRYKVPGLLSSNPNVTLYSLYLLQNILYLNKSKVLSSGKYPTLNQTSYVFLNQSKWALKKMISF